MQQEGQIIPYRCCDKRERAYRMELRNAFAEGFKTGRCGFALYVVE